MILVTFTDQTTWDQQQNIFQPINKIMNNGLFIGHPLIDNMTEKEDESNHGLKIANSPFVLACLM